MDSKCFIILVNELPYICFLLYINIKTIAGFMTGLSMLTSAADIAVKDFSIFSFKFWNILYFLGIVVVAALNILGAVKPTPSPKDLTTSEHRKQNSIQSTTGPREHLSNPEDEQEKQGGTNTCRESFLSFGTKDKLGICSQQSCTKVLWKQ